MFECGEDLGLVPIRLASLVAGVEGDLPGSVEGEALWGRVFGLGEEGRERTGGDEGEQG
jgi:hypothetical protein